MWRLDTFFPTKNPQWGCFDVGLWSDTTDTTEEMTANIKRMQQALGLEKLTSDEVRDYLRKMSILVWEKGS